MPHVYTEIYKIVQSIPKGRVLTYGLISDMIGGRMSAQGVGWALKALGRIEKSKANSKKTAEKKSAEKTSKAKSTSAKKSVANANYDMNTVPWQRVVNSQGGTSTHKIADIPPDLQRIMLEAEGIVFDVEGKLDLKKCLWMDGLA